MKDVFHTLYEIGQILNSTMELNDLLTKIIDLAIKHTNAERGFIITKRGLKIARNIEGEEAEEYISSTVIKKIYETEKPIITIDAQIDPRFYGSKSILKGKVFSICAVPLIHSGKLYGVIYIDSSIKRGIFNEETLKFMELFANIAALAFVNAIKFNKLIKETEELKGFGEIVGTSKPMQEVFELIRKAAATSCTVFIYGESGTGKELVARAIHKNSERVKGEFVPLYCGGLPETLIEAELFGYKKGSFTGASYDKEGLFEVAHNGTLFLDEICDIPISIQTKLLRVLQEGEIRRIGETKVRKVDVRIIAATNKDPKIEIKENRLREDLYYRLNVLEIKLPPLRERKEDIPLLIQHFLRKYNEKEKKEITISERAINRMKNFQWKGNVRELENFIQRAVVTANTNTIEEEQVLKLKNEESEMEKDEPTLEEIEKKIVIERFNAYSGNKEKTAESLGISLRTLYNKLKKWKIT